MIRVMIVSNLSLLIVGVLPLSRPNPQLNNSSPTSVVEKCNEIKPETDLNLGKQEPIHLFLLIDESRTANISDPEGTIRYDAARRVVEYIVSHGYLAGSPPIIHIYQYSSGLPDGNGVYRSTRQIFPPAGSDRPVYLVKPSADCTNCASLSEVFQSLNNYPTNNFEYLDETMAFLKDEVEGRDSSHSIVIIITQGYPLRYGQSPEQVKTNLQNAARAWGDLNVPVDVLLGGKELSSSDLDKFAKLWQEDFYGYLPIVTLRELKPRILQGLPVSNHAQVWKWMTAIFQRQNWFLGTGVENGILDKEEDLLDIPFVPAKLKVIAFKTEFEDEEQSISVTSSAGTSPEAIRPDVPPNPNDRSLVLRWLSEDPVALAGQWTIKRTPSVQDDPTYYLISSTSQQLYINVRPATAIMGSPVYVEAESLGPTSGLPVHIEVKVKDEEAGQEESLTPIAPNSNVFQYTPSLDDFQDNEDGLRTVVLTAMRMEGDKEITRSCALDIVRTPRLTGGMTGAVQPGNELTFTLKIFDYKLFTVERPLPAMTFQYETTNEEMNIEWSEPQQNPDGKGYEGYSELAGTVKLDANSLLPTRAIASISGQTEYGITTNAEWAIELVRQPEQEDLFLALRKRWGWLLVAFIVGSVISRLADPLILRFLRINEKGKTRDLKSGEKDTVYALFLLTVALFCTIIPFGVTIGLRVEIQSIEAWLGIAGFVFSVIAGGVFAGSSTLLLGVSLDKKKLQSSLQPIRSLLSFFKEEIQVFYFLSLFWFAWFFFIYPFATK